MALMVVPFVNFEPETTEKSLANNAQLQAEIARRNKMMQSPEFAAHMAEARELGIGNESSCGFFGGCHHVNGREGYTECYFCGSERITTVPTRLPEEEPPPFEPAERFRLACAMLRKAGKLDHGRPDGQPRLPGQKGKESALEWLVRLGLAPNPQTAAEMLILANGLQPALDELTGSKFEWHEPEEEEQSCRES